MVIGAGSNKRRLRIASQKGSEEVEKLTPTLDAIGKSTSSVLECMIRLEQLLEPIKCYPKLLHDFLPY